jgi:hypothetical protein
MVTTFRLLVTGSRTWTDRDTIDAALTRAWRAAGSPPDAVLVVGRARDGADRFAEECWTARGLLVDPFPAHWKRADGTLHRGAGHERNQRMVDSGASMCVAFHDLCVLPGCHPKPPHGTHGTTDCVARAKRAGIPVAHYLSPRLRAARDPW